MKKVFLISLILVGVLVSTVYAGSLNFNYGRDTYEKCDNYLVVNSLGDETIVSEYRKLGTNDWIPENSVKNYLKLEGYTEAYDYNPQANHYWNVYNRPLPIGINLKELEFNGLLGNPRKAQKVYVIEDEYNKYSAPIQNNRINVNKNNINTNKIKIKNVDDKHTKWNKNQDITLNNHNGRITKNTDKNIEQDSVLKNHDGRISNNTHNIFENSQVIDYHSGVLENHENRLNDHNNRISDLEETKVNIVGEVQFIRGKNHIISAYGKYDVRHGNCPEAGIKFTVGLGKSWEAKEIEKTNVRISRLENMLQLTIMDSIKIKETKTDKGIKLEIDRVDTLKLSTEF